MAGKDSQFAIEVILKAVDRITQPLKSTTTRFGRALKKLKAHTRQLTQAFRTLDRWISRAVTVTAFAAFYGLQRAIRSGISALLEFDQDMMRLISKMPAGIQRGTAAFKGMRKEMLNALKGTEFGPRDVAKAMDVLKTAGFDYKEALGLLTPVSNLATTGMLDLAEAASFAGDMLGAARLRTGDAAQNIKNFTSLVDKAAVAVQKSNMLPQDFYEALRSGGPAVMKLGGDLDFLLASFMALANSAQKRELAGHQMKNVWLNLLTVTPKLLRKLKRQGIDPFTKDKNGFTVLRDGIGLFKMFKRELKDMDPRESAVLLDALFKRRGITGAGILIDLPTQSLQEYYDALKKATGESERMATITRQGLQLRLRRLGAMFDRVKIKLLDLVEGPVVKWLDALDKWLNKISDLIDKDPEFFLKIIRQIGDTLYTMGKALLWAIGIWMGFKVVGTILSVVTLGLQAVLFLLFLISLGVIGLLAEIVLIPLGIMAAVAALMYLFLLLTGKTDEAGAAITAMIDDFKESSGLNTLISQVDTLKSSIDSINTGKINQATQAAQAVKAGGGGASIPKLPVEGMLAGEAETSRGFWAGLGELFMGRHDGIATHAQMATQPFSQGRVIIEDRTGNARIESDSPDWLQLQPGAHSGAAQ